MGHKGKKGKYGGQRGPAQQQPKNFVSRRKGGISNGMKILSAVFIVIIVGGIAYWQVSKQPAPVVESQYPQTVTGIFYSSPTVTTDGAGGSIPYTFASENKLVFFNLKLQNKTDELSYQGRTIPLNLYQGGEYLPLLAISTPSGKLITAIRVCEPCGSFSFHIVQGKYLDCDRCHTQWDIETLSGVSGGCTSYPPPKIPSSVSNSNVDFDLSPTGLRVTA